MADENCSAWRSKTVAPEVEDCSLRAPLEKIKFPVIENVLVSVSRLSYDAAVQAEDRALLGSNLSAACSSEAARWGLVRDPTCSLIEAERIS